MHVSRKYLNHREELIWVLPVAAASILLFLAGQVVGAEGDVAPFALMRDYGRNAIRMLPLLLPILFIIPLLALLFSRSPQPLQDLRRAAGKRFGSAFLALAAVSPLVVMPVMFSGYGALKIMLPHYLPFSWDDALAEIDRALFFGYQPWTITHAIFGGPLATAAIDRLYTSWILLLSIAIVGFALYMPKYDRARFFLSFTAAWILIGVLGAYLLSSAGPCYSVLVGASTAGEFAPLMARLRDLSDGQSPLGAVMWQDVLWEAYANDRPGFGMGISAMPSIHNAVAVLYALALMRFGRAPAIAGWLFAAVIFIGSIHLGWHYAVDGLLAAVAMAGIWWAAGKYLVRSGYVDALAHSERDQEISFPVPASV